MPVFQDLQVVLRASFKDPQSKKSRFRPQRGRREPCGRRVLGFALLAAFLLVFASPAAGAETGNTETIQWVDFSVPYPALSRAMEYDIETYGDEVHLNWIELLAYLGARYGGNFSRYRESELHSLAETLRQGETMERLTADMKYYPYYLTAYSAVLCEFLGEYAVETTGDDGTVTRETRYGLTAFHPIAAGFAATHYDDFGNPRSYGYRRKHLGHDIFGATGTPVIAVESGIVEVMGWNQYGGWRIGIRSFDGTRYYYYAHLRQNRPFHPDLKEGRCVRAGDVIGYMGHTGYSKTENVNNIEVPHLHLGLQLIFEPDKESCEIWIDLFAITELLQKNRSETYRVPETKEFYRK